MGASTPVALELPEGVDLQDLERIACIAAEVAGDLVVSERPATLDVSAKSTRTDVVTEMDQASQELLIQFLGERRPQDGVVGEEEGAAVGSSGVTWVLDPIDGTTNYLYGIPAYAVSVAAVVGDPSVPGGWRSIAGAVLNPVSGELFHAHLGGGARLTTDAGTVALSTTDASDLGLALVGTGFGYDAEVRERQARALVELLPRVRDIRRAGSAALDLCSVACGRLDAYYETGLNAWDRAAGELIAREAGAVVCGLTGPDAGKDLTIAVGPGLAADVLAIVRDLTRRHVTGIR